jgi:cytochrome c1
VADRYEFDGIQWDAKGYYGVPEVRPAEREPDKPGDQPWWSWAATFTRIKQGDFAAVPRLLKLRADILDPVLLQSYYFLFGDACPASQVVQLRPELEDEDDDETVLLAADALATIGRLADVPSRRL